MKFPRYPRIQRGRQTDTLITIFHTTSGGKVMKQDTTNHECVIRMAKFSSKPYCTARFLLANKQLRSTTGCLSRGLVSLAWYLFYIILYFTPPPTRFHRFCTEISYPTVSGFFPTLNVQLSSVNLKINEHVLLKTFCV